MGPRITRTHERLVDKNHTLGCLKVAVPPPGYIMICAIVKVDISRDVDWSCELQCCCDITLFYAAVGYAFKKKHGH